MVNNVMLIFHVITYHFHGMVIDINLILDVYFMAIVSAVICNYSMIRHTWIHENDFMAYFIS